MHIDELDEIGLQLLGLKAAQALLTFYEMQRLSDSGEDMEGFEATVKHNAEADSFPVEIYGGEITLSFSEAFERATKAMEAQIDLFSRTGELQKQMAMINFLMPRMPEKKEPKDEAGE